jgi:hypothetical protein
MKQSVNLSDFRDAFHRYGRKNQFTYEALGILFDYMEEVESDTGEEVELDVIAICCEYSEGSPSDVAESYGIEAGDDEEELSAAVIAYLEEEGAYIGTTSAGDLVYRQF